MPRPALSLILLLLLLCAGTHTAAAQSTVFVVRHTDRGPEEPDALLTPLGHRQAEDLAALLADAGIRRIFTTEFTRTQQTAAPTARRTGVVPVVVTHADLDGLIAQIRSALHAGEATLVVGHNTTVPRIVKTLGGGDIPPVAHHEFTRLVAVTLFPDGRTSTVTLRFGLSLAPAAARPD